MQRVEAVAAGAQIVMRAPGRGLDQRIVAGLQIEKSVQRVVDQRVREGVKLENRAVGKLDVEQALQRALDMREHVGARHDLPGMAPRIVDAEKGLALRVPGNQRQEIGIAVACDRAAHPFEAEAALAMCSRAHGWGSGIGEVGASSAVGCVSFVWRRIGDWVVLVGAGVRGAPTIGRDRERRIGRELVEQPAETIAQAIIGARVNEA